MHSRIPIRIENAVKHSEPQTPFEHVKESFYNEAYELPEEHTGLREMYLEIWAWIRVYDRGARTVQKIQTEHSYSRSQAYVIMNQTVSLFNIDTNAQKKAHRNVAIEKAMYRYEQLADLLDDDTLSTDERLRILERMGKEDDRLNKLRAIDQEDGLDMALLYEQIAQPQLIAFTNDESLIKKIQQEKIVFEEAQLD